MTTTYPESRTTLNWGIALSLLLHLAFTILSQLDSLPDFNLRQPEQVMEVEMVREPPPPLPPPPPPKVMEQPPPPPPRPEPAQAPSHTPVAPPPLHRARIAEHSSAPKQPPQDQGISFENRKSAPPKAGELSQSAQDFILAQVLRMWRFDTNPAKGSNLTISMTILVNRDGTLNDAMNKNAKWNPGAVIRGYDQLPDGYVKHALESMLLALRLAQPLELPPDDGKGWPRRMVITFRPGDL